ncbi:MAG: VanZ family protein [Cetobacterium sp.]
MITSKGIKRVVRESSIKINVRKKAHFFIYLALGSSAFLGTGKRGGKEMLATLCFVTLYAISDEYHQSFVNGRGASPYDVGIDSFGGALGIALSKIGFYKR